MAIITKQRFQYNYIRTAEGHNRVEALDNKTGERFFTLAYDHRKPMHIVDKLVESVTKAYISYCSRVEKNRAAYKRYVKMIERFSVTGEYFCFQPWFEARQEAYEFVNAVGKAYAAYHK